MSSRRAALAAVGAAWALLGCGFHLRGERTYPFAQVWVDSAIGGELAQGLRRALQTQLTEIAPTDPRSMVARVRVLSEQPERVVVGTNASGQVRELQLRLRATLRVQLHAGAKQQVWSLVQQRDFGYNESYALAKEVEEAAVFRDLRADLVQQALRRLTVLRDDDMPPASH